MSAANQFFNIYELLYLTFTQVQLDAGNSGLLALTRVNVVLSSVSLDLLWQRQESLAPLFRVLPCVSLRYLPGQTLFYIHAEDDTKVHIAPEHWQRLQFYARRIKVLDDKPPLLEGGNHLHKPIIKWSVLSAAMHLGVLLPNIHSLIFGPRMSSFLEYMEVRLRYKFNRDGTQTAHVSVYRIGKRRCINDLCRLDQLQTFGIQPDCDLELLPILRRHSGLTELHLQKLGQDDWDDHGVWGDLAAPRPGFRGLTALHLSDPLNLLSAATVLKNMSTWPLKLRELSVTGCYDNLDYTSDAQAVYSAVRKACDPTTLTHLTIETHGHDRNPVSAQELFCDLLVFPNITHAHIAYNCLHADVDGALDAMTEAWPDLEVLHFVNQPPYHNYYEFYCRKSSLDSLACLARRCPRLEFLALDLDLSAVPAPLTATEDQQTLDRDLILDVGDNEIQCDTAALGAFLASVFPTIRTIQCVGFDEEEAWSHVVETINSIRFSAPTGDALDAQPEMSQQNQYEPKLPVAPDSEELVDLETFELQIFAGSSSAATQELTYHADSTNQASDDSKAAKTIKASRIPRPVNQYKAAKKNALLAGNV
ncbi:hypothetical protein BD626DRAFT_536526 [Schizophyllum amplum]|uniref:Uncharacterized protein n=1 Tax=Schizophyllum amplum TaxID=97359 RepID=A0A550CIN3_9AGAR|nr:hypothetical protein BD626DRAFT_536526 [Auriculariopsis ampla]